MGNINLKKLAKELNLAVSTVSRALRDSHEISQQTKNRVKALAEKLGFQPNPHASSLRQNKSRTIAVIIPEIENSFFSQVMNGVEEVARKKGYHVLVYLSHDDQMREKDILQLLRSGRVDGWMISISNTTNSLEYLNNVQHAGIPFVFFDRVLEQADVPKITTDDADAAFNATEHLISKGAQRIAFLSLSPTLSISNRRRNGYERALKKHNLFHEELIIECGPDDKLNRQKIKELLQEKNPDAIFAAVEKLAINTYEVCLEIDIEIPKQLLVIGFSNLSAAGLFSPPLSTIVQPAFEMGKEAAAILFKLIENKVLVPGERNLMIPSKFVERGST